MIQIIRRWPDSALKTPTRPFDGTPDEARSLIDNLTETMHDAQGQGLAANQIGVDLSVFVYLGPGEKHVINPSLGRGMNPKNDKEGCLSLPALRRPVKRFHYIVLKGSRLEGDLFIPFEEALVDEEARVVQHEYQHLRGQTILGR